MLLLIDKLTSINYNVWALRMQHYLKHEALWRYVSHPPDEATEEDVLRDERALATIVLSVSASQLVHVAGKLSAKAAWDSLKDVYVQKSAGSLISLMRQLYQTVMMPGSSVELTLILWMSVFKCLNSVTGVLMMRIKFC